MLYDAYQAYRDAVAPLRRAAGAVRQLLDAAASPGAQPPLWRGAAAVLDLFSHAGLSHERPAFGVRSVLVEGREIAVTERAVATHPFCRLLHFRKEASRDAPMVLVVAPLSGHFSTLVRGTVATLLLDHDVFLTDWRNARDV